MNIDQEIVMKEFTFRTSRSSGAGGQNVNKVETRVEVLFNIPESASLSDVQKARVFARLKNRINSEGVLAVSCGETRSQGRNRQIATDRLLELIRLSLEKKKIRKKTGIPTSVKRKRLDNKKRQSEKKSRRRPDAE